MLGILLLYFIGRHFYRLAFEYKKQQWTYTILGIVAYYVGTAFAGVFLLMISESPEAILEKSQLLLGLFAIPFGLFACYLFHLYLVRKWMLEQQYEESENDILDQDFIEKDEDDLT